MKNNFETISSFAPESNRIVGEDLETIQQIESFLLNNYHQYGERGEFELAFRSAGEILGAKLGIKPTSLTTIELVENGHNTDIEAFEGMLSKLGLTAIPEDIGGVKRRYFYGKDTDLVQQAYDDFHKLWQTEVDTDERSEIDKRLGFLLGYPESAVLGGAYVGNLSKTAQRKLDKQYPNQLISHTQEHIAEEYAAYEQKIFSAIKEYCPNIYRAHERPRKQSVGNKILNLFSR